MRVRKKNLEHTLYRLCRQCCVEQSNRPDSGKAPVVHGMRSERDFQKEATRTTKSVLKLKLPTVWLPADATAKAWFADPISASASSLTHIHNSLPVLPPLYSTPSIPHPSSHRRSFCISLSTTFSSRFPVSFISAAAISTLVFAHWITAVHSFAGLHHRRSLVIGFHTPPNNARRYRIHIPVRSTRLHRARAFSVSATAPIRSVRSVLLVLSSGTALLAPRTRHSRF